MEIYRKKNKLLLGLAGCVAFAVLALAMLAGGPSPDSVFPPFRWALFFYPLCLVLLAGSLYFASIAAKGLRNPKPLLTLTDEGVVADGFAGQYRASWDELSGYAMQSGSLCVLKLKDPEGFVARQPDGRPRKVARSLTDRFGSPFLIDTANMEPDLASIRAWLEGRLPELAR